jgi:hypothetical protein
MKRPSNSSTVFGNQTKLHNLVLFPHLKSLDAVFTERIQEYSHYMFASRKVTRMVPGLQNFETRFFFVSFTFKGI